MNQST